MARMTDGRFPRHSLVRGLAAAFALAAGFGIAWMDTRPGWDDTGITAGAIGIVAALAALARVPWWLAAVLAVGPILIAELSSGRGVLLAVPIAVAGAWIGTFMRRLGSVAGASRAE